MIHHTDIENDISYYKKQLELSTGLKKLYCNSDFMLVFMKHYCEEYVLYLVSKLSQYSSESNEHKEILKELSAISYFQKYIDNINRNGAMAITTLNELNAIPTDEIDYD